MGCSTSRQPLPLRLVKFLKPCAMRGIFDQCTAQAQTHGASGASSSHQWRARGQGNFLAAPTSKCFKPSAGWTAARCRCACSCDVAAVCPLSRTAARGPCVLHLRRRPPICILASCFFKSGLLSLCIAFLKRQVVPGLVLLQTVGALCPGGPLPLN